MIKNIILSLTAISTFALSASAEDAKTYVLAKKDYMPPAGTVLESTESMELNEGKMQMNIQGQAMEGLMSISENSTEKVEILAVDKIRYTLTEGESKQQMVMMGQAMPAENKSKAIVGKAILITKKDGTWSADLEKGEATVLEAPEIKSVAEKRNNQTDHKVYGTVPRKVGDEWEVDGADMMGMEDMKGKVKVKFVKIEKFNGVDCAVLDCSMDLKGAPKDMKGVGMTVAGKVVVHRSLKDMVDLNADFSGSMVMDGNMEPQPGMKIGMKMKGQMTMKSLTKVAGK